MSAENAAFFDELNRDMVVSDSEDLSNAWWWFYVLTGLLFVAFVAVVLVMIWRTMRGTPSIDATVSR